MAIEAILIGQQQAVFADNIVNPYMTFNNAITYDFTSGVGNATVTNSDEKTLVGSKAMKIRALTTSSCNFNANDSFDFIIQSDGVHNIQFRAWKSDPDAIVNMVVNVFIDGALTADRTINVLMDSDNGFVDDSWNLFYQSFTALNGDNASISFYFQSDTVDCIVYLDAFKVEANNQNQLAPSLYTDPQFLINKWSRIYDFDNTQLLFEDTAINFSLFEGTFESNCGSEILVEGVGFKPTRLNSFFTVNANFLAKVPTGTTPHIEAELNINGTTYYGDCKFLQKAVDGLEYVNFSFQIPCNAEFLQFDGALELIAKGNDIEISRRVLTISETVNSN
jgi:hypothetical protein